MQIASIFSTTSVPFPLSRQAQLLMLRGRCGVPFPVVGYEHSWLQAGSAWGVSGKAALRIYRQIFVTDEGERRIFIPLPCNGKFFKKRAVIQLELTGCKSCFSPAIFLLRRVYPPDASQ